MLLQLSLPDLKNMSLFWSINRTNNYRYWWRISSCAALRSTSAPFFSSTSTLTCISALVQLRVCSLHRKSNRNQVISLTESVIRFGESGRQHIRLTPSKRQVRPTSFQTTPRAGRAGNDSQPQRRFALQARPSRDSRDREQQQASCPSSQDWGHIFTSPLLCCL